VKEFDPVTNIDNSQLILDQGEWPNFHDAEVHQMNIWRGDIRPEENIWIGPVIDITFELCALKDPFMTTLRFRDCEAIRMEAFNHQNALYDLGFSYEPRGVNNQGEALTPYISVNFEQAFGMALSFKCFTVEVISRKNPAA
jgi:hypothetical protein